MWEFLNRRALYIEATINVLVSFVSNYVAAFVALPFFGITPQHPEVLGLTCVMAVVAWGRCCVLRHLFGRWAIYRRAHQISLIQLLSKHYNEEEDHLWCDLVGSRDARVLDDVRPVASTSVPDNSNTPNQ